jgi:VanZ family protein
VLGLLLYRALRGERVPLWPAIVLAALLTSTYGASDEWHQAFVPRRTSDVADWLADTIGGGTGAIAYGAAAKFKKSRWGNRTKDPG